MSRFTCLLSGLLVGVALAIAGYMYREHIIDTGCTVTVKSAAAQSGPWEATLTTKECGWGFGLSAFLASVKVQKGGANGWYAVYDLEVDESNFIPPLVRWVEPGHLEVVVSSNRAVGSLETRNGDFRLVRIYQAPK